MSISLLHGRNDPAEEADWLCELIAKHADALKKARVGSQFQLSSASFRVHSRGRNVIYRVCCRFNWFLKLPKSRDPGPIVRERLGIETIARALADAPEYWAYETRVSVDPGYVLAAAIPGHPLNAIVLTRSWLPGERTAAHLERCFANLGTLLARLHTDATIATDLPPATTRPFETLRTLLEQVKKPDVTAAAIQEWCDTRSQHDTGEGFIHGNLRLNNILGVGARLGFIDLENSGSGSFYNDLSRPVSELLLAHCLWVFPRRRAIRFLKAFVQGYGRGRLYDPKQLVAFVGARIARYYLETQVLRLHSPRVGGIPIASSRLRELTGALMSDRLQQLVPQWSSYCDSVQPYPRECS